MSSPNNFNIYMSISLPPIHEIRTAKHAIIQNSPILAYTPGWYVFTTYMNPHSACWTLSLAHPQNFPYRILHSLPIPTTSA